MLFILSFLFKLLPALYHDPENLVRFFKSLFPIVNVNIKINKIANLKIGKNIN